jgi:hypothetical protein
VIGVPAKPNLAPASPAVLDTSAIDAGLAEQIAESTAELPSIQLGTRLPGQLPVDIFLTAKQMQHLTQWQVKGLTEAQIRLTAIAAVRGSVASAPVVSYGQKAAIFSILDSSSAEVVQIQAKMGADQLADQTKADLRRLYSLHVLTFVLPQAKQMLTGYQLGDWAAYYASTLAPMPVEIINAESLGCNVTTAQADVSELSRQIAILRSDSYSLLAFAQSVSPAGFYRQMFSAGHPAEHSGQNAVARAAVAAAGASAAIASLHAQGC